MIMFQTMSFWDGMRIPRRKLKKRFKCFFGENSRTIEDRQEALDILMNITSTIQNEMVDALTINRNIERDIIDACNIWIENCVLYQHDLDIKNLNVKKEFVMDYALIIDMYLYGFASRAISLLTLSKKIGEENTFYGLEIILEKDVPAEVLKYHPYIYFNTIITGNQNVLVDTPLTPDANDTEFGKGFFAETKVQFLLFLAAIRNFHKFQLRDDEKSLTVISKKEFISLVESYTNRKIEDGEAAMGVLL